MPIHLAVDGSGLERPLAGVGTYTREVLRAMAIERPGNRVTVWGRPGDGRHEIPRARLVGRHLLWPARLRSSRADAYFGPAGLLPLGGLGMPAVITIHDLAIYRHPEWFPAGQSLSVKLVVPRSIRRADAVLAVSQNTARDVEALFRVQAEVVFEGVRDSYRPLDPEDLALVRIRLGLPERFILFVSTVEPRKNLPTLLEAWARMRRRPALVVAGGWGWRYEEVQGRLERLGEGVRLLGPVERRDLPALYNLATLLAHPAWYEGFGLTPLEAMACGTPVVASNAASLPEVVGDAGLLVDPADVEAWTQALERLCEDPDLQTTLRRRGVLRAAEFTWAKTAERTWRALERSLR